MGYIAIQQILDDLRDHPLLDDIDLERVINYTVSFVRKVGCPRLFEDQTVELKVKNYRVDLPCDFIDIKGVKHKNGNALVSTTDIHFMEHIKKKKDKPCVDKFIQADLNMSEQLGDFENLELSKAFVEPGVLSDKDLEFIKNHPNIKNVILFIIDKKIREFRITPPPKFERKFIHIDDADLLGIDSTLQDTVRDIIITWFINHRLHHKHHHNPPSFVPLRDQVNYDLRYVNREPDYESSLDTSTYKIQGNKLFTSFEEGDIVLTYTSIALDENGYPLVYDDESFTTALKSYIKLQKFTILFDLNRISGQVYNNAYQEYCFNVGQAQTSLVRLNLDQMETFSRSWNQLFQNITSHRRGFKELSNREFIKRH